MVTPLRFAVHLSWVSVVASTLWGCTTILGIDTEHEPNPCNTTGSKGALAPLVCSRGACRTLVPRCDSRGLPNSCPPPEPAKDEQCNDGLDNNCNGVVDEGCTCEEDAVQPCYRGSGDTKNTGLCVEGTQTCKNGVWGDCSGDVLPTAEICDQRNNDCDEYVDESPDCQCRPEQKQACYTGPSETLGHISAPCREGTQICSSDGTWGDCIGSVAPGLEACDDIDNNCNGIIDEGCPCQAGDRKSCYSGPTQPLNTENVPSCHSGSQSCVKGKWSDCIGEVNPSPEQCNGLDDDCNGKVDDGDFGKGAPCTIPGLLGPCATGNKDCSDQGSYCRQTILPEAGETCNGKDDDCNGLVDDNDPGGGGDCTLLDPAILGKCRQGKLRCTGGQVVCVQVNTPKPETCNEEDDDCNGIVNDGNFCCLTNRIRDGNETGINCGGSCVIGCGTDCHACPAHDPCIQDIDCQSKICKSNVCQTPACSDLVLNGLESDIDCGGGGQGCKLCEVGKLCNIPSDCVSGVCAQGACSQPQCIDKVQNQGETGIDCGGPCSGCGAGEKCSSTGDCKSKVCTDGYCVSANCEDRTPNGDETDVDCGGSCGACLIGKKCTVPNDCRSGVCSGGECQSPSCFDGATNGSEADLDCGGPCPTKCGVTKFCKVPEDCGSGVCESGVCANKGLGAKCNAPSECKSGRCVDDVCCDDLCDKKCYACSRAKKNLGSDGYCEAIAAGGDPDEDCVASDVGSCKFDGACDGGGSCRLYAPSTVCAEAACSKDGLSLTKAGTCDGLGTCVNGAQVSCGNYLCSEGACFQVCSETLDGCAPETYCNGKVCLAQKANGKSCSLDKECLSLQCSAEGVCCDQKCGGACRSCLKDVSITGVDGACSPVKKSAIGKGQCTRAPEDTCGQTGVCNGSGDCALYDSSQVCQQGYCSTSDELQKSRHCNSGGSCVNEGTTHCGNYICSGNACLAAPCANSDQCVAVAYCDKGVCQPRETQGAQCVYDRDCIVGRHCVDGVCCDTGSASDKCGTCQACNLNGAGTCSDVLAGNSDNDTCPSPRQCSGAGICRYPLGVKCSPNGINVGCLSNFCVDGVCCKTESCGKCSACNVANDGFCANVPLGLKDPDSCNAEGVACNGDGACRDQDGTECTDLTGASCASKNCVEGVCCDNECSGTCKTCKRANSIGHCDDVPDNSSDDSCPGPNQVCISRMCAISAGGAGGAGGTSGRGGASGSGAAGGV